MNDYLFEISLVISHFSFVIPVILPWNQKMLQFLGKQSQKDSLIFSMWGESMSCGTIMDYQGDESHACKQF